MRSIARPLQGRGRGRLGDRIHGRHGTPSIGSEFKLRVGLELRRLREAIGLTQQELGDRLGLANTTISHQEIGKSFLEAEYYGPLADIFKVSRSSLGKMLLRHRDPHVFALIYGEHHDEQLPDDLRRLSNVRPPKPRG